MVREEKNGRAILVTNYTDTNVSDKVVKIIQSYVGAVNKMAWIKQEKSPQKTLKRTDNGNRLEAV